MYEFYVEEYRGTVIPNVTTFKSLVNEATAYVDGYVHCTDNLKYEQVERKYKMAICAVADCLYNATCAEKEVQSESVGNHSITYRTKTADEYRADMRKRAMSFLYGTGLMYSAM